MVTSSEGNCQICHICRSFPSNLSNSSTRRGTSKPSTRHRHLSRAYPLSKQNKVWSQNKIWRLFGTFCWNILETLCSACRFWAISALFNETGSACPACDNSHAGPVQATKDGWPSICSKQAVEHVFTKSGMSLRIEGHWRILKDIESETIYLKLSETCWNSTFFSSLLMVKRPSQRLCTRKRKRRRRRNLLRLRGERWWNIAHTFWNWERNCYWNR